MGKILDLIPESLHEDLTVEVLEEIVKNNGSTNTRINEKIKALAQKQIEADKTLAEKKEKLAKQIERIVDNIT